MDAEEFGGFDFSERIRNQTISDEDADVFTALLARLVEKREIQVLARMAVAVISAISHSLHTHDEDGCSPEGGCKHASEFGYTLSMVMASGKANRMLAGMELSNLAIASAYALAIMEPDDSEVSTPRAVLEHLAETFVAIEDNPELWEQSRTRTRDTLEMEALLDQIQNLPEAQEPEIQF